MNVCVCVCVGGRGVMYWVSFDHKCWCSVRGILAWRTFLLDCWHKVHNYLHCLFYRDVIVNKTEILFRKFLEWCCRIPNTCSDGSLTLRASKRSLNSVKAF